MFLVANDKWSLWNLCAAEDLEAEQDEMDSSSGSVLELLDTTPAASTPNSVKHHVSGATGGRSGLKLSRQTSEKTTKSLEPKAKKSPRTPLQGSAGCKRLRRNLGVEPQISQLTSDVNELVESENRAERTSRNSVEGLENQTSATTRPPLSSEKKSTQRITRRNSDLKLVESDTVQGEPLNSKDICENTSAANSCTETE